MEVFYDTELQIWFAQISSTDKHWQFIWVAHRMLGFVLMVMFISLTNVVSFNLLIFYYILHCYQRIYSLIRIVFLYSQSNASKMRFCFDWKPWNELNWASNTKLVYLFVFLLLLYIYVQFWTFAFERQYFVYVCDVGDIDSIHTNLTNCCRNSSIFNIVCVIWLRYALSLEYFVFTIFHSCKNQ